MGSVNPEHQVKKEKREKRFLKRRFFKEFILTICCVLLFIQCKPGDSSESNQTSEPDENKSSVVALFIDVATYENLKTEINRYADDIKRDMKVEVKLYNQNFTTAEEIRDILKDLHKKNDLKGSVLIGDLPTATYEYIALPWGARPTMPSDRFFMVMSEDSFLDTDNDGMYEIDRMTYNDNRAPVKMAWSGRIKGYNGDYSVLKRYFDRNHEYRTGKMEVKPTIFVYSMGNAGPVHDDPEIYKDNLRDSFTRDNNLYSKEQVVVQSEDSADNFLRELQKNHESVVVHCHGWHKIQNLLHTKDGDFIRPQQLTEHPPNGLFYYQVSCGTGAFTEEDYLSGHYLYNGRGLVCIAYTTTGLFKCFDDSYKYFPHLEKGLCFGEAMNAFLIEKSTYNGKVNYIKWEHYTVLLGDPTLKMRR